MNLDEVIAGWRSHDGSTLYGVVDRNLLHETLRREQAKLEKQWRGERWVMIAATALFLFVTVLILNMGFSHDGERLTGWDYSVAIAGVAAGFVLAAALVSLLRIRRARQEGFGDSLRDHLRRRIAQLHDEATRESRLGFITLVAGVIFMWAYPFVGHRVSVPQGESDWPSPLVIVLIVGFFCWVWFRSVPLERQRKLSRKRQLEALLKELDGE